MKIGKLKRYLPTGRHAVIGVPFFWLFLFFLLPFFIVLKISFAEADVAIPPYTEIYSYAEQKLQVLLNLGNYAMLGDDELYIAAYLGSLKMAQSKSTILLPSSLTSTTVARKMPLPNENFVPTFAFLPGLQSVSQRLFATCFKSRNSTFAPVSSLIP